MSQQIHNRKVMEPIRRELRKAPTRAEDVLWESLRRCQLQGRKFRRQHSIGSYVVDFYCPAERLVVEVDGSVHQTPGAQARDQDRDNVMAGLAIAVIRVSNDEVFNQIDLVLSQIAGCFSRG
jgi:very-short-patch-repair endonuclease